VLSIVLRWPLEKESAEYRWHILYLFK